jgi:hypothetical protein
LMVLMALTASGALRALRRELRRALRRQAG